MLLQVVGYIIVGFGIVTIISGIVGLFRFPDFYTKIHAVGVIDSCGMILSFSGLLLLQTDFLSVTKMVVIMSLVLLLGPVATHALCRASLSIKQANKV